MRTFWVIEFTGEFPRVPGVVNYHCIRDGEPPALLDWTGEIHEALQFSREIDAVRYWNWAATGSFVTFREHEWLVPTPAYNCSKQVHNWAKVGVVILATVMGLATYTVYVATPEHVLIWSRPTLTPVGFALALLSTISIVLGIAAFFYVFTEPEKETPGA